MEHAHLSYSLNKLRVNNDDAHRRGKLSKNPPNATLFRGAFHIMTGRVRLPGPEADRGHFARVLPGFPAGGC